MCWFGEPKPSDKELGQGYRLFRLVNAERQKHNLPRLMPLEALDNAAWKRARDMAKPNHKKGDQDTGGLYPNDRAKKAGYTSPISEARADNARSAKAVVGGWMTNPEDRKKLLRRDFTVTGVAFHRNHYVQVFGHDSRK